MPIIRTPAIVCTVRPHGEHGAVVRLFTREHGLQAGYVRGGRSRALRPVLQPANLVTAELRARTAEQLAGLTVELIESRAPLYAEPLPAAALQWLTLAIAHVLPEGAAYPRLYDAFAATLDAIAGAPSARGWAAALVRLELLLLAELGFGLDLEQCVVTGIEEDLAFVSPKSAAAVSRAAAIGHEAKLLPLPAFLIAGGEADWDAILAGLKLTGHFLETNLFDRRGAEIWTARQALLSRLQRAAA